MEENKKTDCLKKLIGKPCMNMVDLSYRCAKGHLKELKKGRKLTVLNVMGGQFILRWGSKMFVVDPDMIQILS